MTYQNLKGAQPLGSPEADVSAYDEMVSRVPGPAGQFSSLVGFSLAMLCVVSPEAMPVDLELSLRNQDPVPAKASLNPGADTTGALGIDNENSRERWQPKDHSQGTQPTQSYGDRADSLAAASISPADTHRKEEFVRVESRDQSNNPR